MIVFNFICCNLIIYIFKEILESSGLKGDIFKIWYSIYK